MKPQNLTVVTCIVLFLTLNACSPAQLTSLMIVNASSVAIVYAPNTVTQYDVDGECSYTNQVCEWIEDCFLSYDYCTNFLYNSSATIENYVDYTEFCEGFENAAVFSKGHASADDVIHSPTRHHFLHAYGNILWDNMIYDVTGGKANFVFLWHCGTAEDYTGQTCWNCSEGVSFPYCWTKDNSMNLDGYYADEGNHVFLGHMQWSHQFLDDTGYGEYNNYGYFCAVIFQYLNYGYSVAESLDFASQDAFGVSAYCETPLYEGETINNVENCRLWVLGNGDLGI